MLADRCFGVKFLSLDVAIGNVYYYAEDMLGSSRTIVQSGQTTACYDADFTPFGTERAVTNSCPQSYKFEGKERDTETNNDDFGAHYYSSRFGRWLSADWSAVPAPVPYANLSNPQTLNLYAMVSDNPETFADLDGHCSAQSPGGSNRDCAQEQTQEQQTQQQQTQTTQPQANGAAVGTGVVATAEKIVDATVSEVDKVAKPLIESAADDASALVSGGAKIGGGILGGVAAGVVMAGDFLLNAPATASRSSDETKQYHSAGQSPQPETSNSSKRHTHDKHFKPRPGRKTTKDRQKPGWKPRTPLRPQDRPPKED